MLGCGGQEGWVWAGETHLPAPGYRSQQEVVFYNPGVTARWDHWLEPRPVAIALYALAEDFSFHLASPSSCLGKNPLKD